MPPSPEEDAARNDRLAEGNRKRGAPTSKGDTGGNALDAGQPEPPVPSKNAPSPRSPHVQDVHRDER